MPLPQEASPIPPAVLDAGAVKDDYVLDYTWDGDSTVTWTLVQGQMQKRQDGSYTLVETDGTDAVTVEQASGAAAPRSKEAKQ